MPATLKNRFPQIIVTLPRRVQLAVRRGAESIAEEARIRAPDAPPEGKGLVEAIHVESTRRFIPGGKGSGGYLVVAGDDDVFWGHFQEFGTTQHAPQPFLIPAAEAKKDEVAAGVTVVLKTL